MRPRKKTPGWLAAVARLNAVFGYDPAYPTAAAGRQNRHHGRQPGSLKRRRDMVRRSRRKNRRD